MDSLYRVREREGGGGGMGQSKLRNEEDIVCASRESKANWPRVHLLKIRTADSVSQQHT